MERRKGSQKPSSRSIEDCVSVIRAGGEGVHRTWESAGVLRDNIGLTGTKFGCGSQRFLFYVSRSIKLLIERRPLNGFASGTKFLSMQAECSELRR